VKPASLKVIEKMRAKRDELKKSLSDLEEEIASLSGDFATEDRPVVAAEFLKEPGEFTWQVGGLIAQGTVSMLVAAPSVGKTTLMVQTSLALSVGQDVLGFRVSRPVKVLYILAEGSRHAFRERLRVTCGSMGVDVDALDWWVQPGKMSDFRLSGAETDKAIRSSGAKLIVLDTLGYFSGGDENQADLWKARVMAPLRAYCAEYECSFVLLHHEKKGQPGYTIDRSERGRGTSAMLGDCDHVWLLERFPVDEDASGDQRAEMEKRRELHVVKNKYGLADYAVQMTFDKPKGIFNTAVW